MPDIHGGQSFFEIITAAVSYFTEHGYDSPAALDEWMLRIRAAAERELIPERDLQAKVNEALRAVYQRMVEQCGLLRHHPDLTRFTLARVKPKLRAELDRRIMSSASLIRLNRAAAIETTLQRFAGWATSIPVGGGDRVVERNSVKTEIRKALASLPFRERRVAIDQGSKLLANLSDILAVDGGALAGIWHTHYTRFPRETHAARNGKVYAIRGSWAQERGLLKAGPAGYTDEITKPGEEVYCRCTYQYVHSLGRLPPDMLTQNGAAELARVREEMRAA